MLFEFIWFERIDVVLLNRSEVVGANTYWLLRRSDVYMNGGGEFRPFINAERWQDSLEEFYSLEHRSSGIIGSNETDH